MNLPNNYDQWRLASPDDDRKCECHFCEELTDINDTLETDKGDLVCSNCGDDCQQCASCNRVITEQSYDNEYCDSCNESKADKLHDASKGETY